MNRILFVDDDLSVLETLRVRMGRMRGQWDMTFLDSGPQAIQEFQRAPYDIVMSDIQMPGMGGLRLLRTIGERWPHAVRIALSDRVDAPLSIHIMPVAHRLLSKPCEAPHPENVIEDCLRAQKILPAARLRCLVGRVRRLAPLRTSLARLRSLLASRDPNIAEVAELVTTDAVIGARLLQAVNSEFFVVGCRATSVKHAVHALELSVVRDLIASGEIFSQWQDKSRLALADVRRPQMHTASSALTEPSDPDHAPASHGAELTALLADIGYQVLAQECPRELAAATELERGYGLSIDDAEQKAIGASRTTIGAYLLALWGVPHAAVAAAAHCHSLEKIEHGAPASAHHRDYSVGHLGESDASTSALASLRAPNARAIPAPSLRARDCRISSRAS